MKFELWYLALGGLMLVIAFLDRHVKRLPITTTILYLAAGIALGPFGLGWIQINPLRDAAFLERATELGVIISLFTAGLKLHSPPHGRRWQMPVRLASLSMLITVGLITMVGVWLLGLPLGAAVLLGAILAPTDPVLASDVQLEHPGDRDRLRFGLTGEAGLNDGTAFPFVMLGLGLLGLHEIGSGAWRWFSVDLIWAVVGGLGIGAILGGLVGRYIKLLRRRNQETIGRDEFIALGLIGFSYGLAVLAHAYGFLAVFAAGIALRYREAEISEREDGGQETYVTGPVLGANEQLERLMEIGLVLILGGMLSREFLSPSAWWFAPLLFFVIRPVAVVLGTIGGRATLRERALISWFGIRGIGSLYYLMFALEKGVAGDLAHQLCALVLTIVAVSTVAHGLSVTPIMRNYDARKK